MDSSKSSNKNSAFSNMYINNLIRNLLITGLNEKNKPVKISNWGNGSRWKEVICEHNATNINCCILAPCDKDPLKKRYYKQLLSESIDIYEQVEDTKNSKAMIGSVKFITSSNNVDFEKMTDLGLDYHTQGEEIIFSIFCILDSGAESNFVDIDILEMLKPPPLPQKGP